MVTPKVNSSKLKDAIDRFGSLQNALEALQKEKLALTRDNNQLKQENTKLKLNREKLSAEVTNLEDELNSNKIKLKLILENIEQYKRQYELFEGFLAMVVGSPSVRRLCPSIDQFLAETTRYRVVMLKDARRSTNLFCQSHYG